jgi:hypothetical protein
MHSVFSIVRRRANNLSFSTHSSIKTLCTSTTWHGLSLKDCEVIDTTDKLKLAVTDLSNSLVIGFDTESKPVFVRGQKSRGPHLIQLSTREKAYLFPIKDTGCEPLLLASLREILQNEEIVKTGFDLVDDIKKIEEKLNMTVINFFDLATEIGKCGPPIHESVSDFYWNGRVLVKKNPLLTSNLSDRNDTNVKNSAKILASPEHGKNNDSPTTKANDTIGNSVGSSVGSSQGISDVRVQSYNMMGVVIAMRIFFNLEFIKMKRISKSDWSTPDLNAQQILYAANDAHAALVVYLELQKRIVQSSNSSSKVALTPSIALTS